MNRTLYSLPSSFRQSSVSSRIASVLPVFSPTNVSGCIWNHRMTSMTPEKGRCAHSTASGDQYARSYHAATRSRSAAGNPNRTRSSRTLSSCVVISGMRRLRK